MRIQPNAWRSRRWPGNCPPGWRLGFFTGQRKLIAKAYYPGALERLAAGGQGDAYWHVMNFTPGSRDSADSQVVPSGELAMLAMMANTDQAGLSFTGQLYQVLPGAEVGGHRLTRMGINFGNLFGSAQRPFYFRRPYFPPSLAPILGRVANLTTATNTIQVVLFGVRRKAMPPDPEAPALPEPRQAMALAVEQAQLQAGTGVSPTPVARAPWLDMPPGGQAFRFVNQAAITLPAIGAEATVVTFTVPAGRNGVIQLIANQAITGGWLDGSGDVVWRIEVNGVAHQGFNSILASMGSMSNPGDISNSPIRVFENQVVNLIIRNVAVAVAGQPLLGMLAGFFYPVSADAEGGWL